MKHNDVQGTYHSVPQKAAEPEEATEPKKEQNSECLIESDQNHANKISRTPSKEDIVDDEKKLPMSPLRKFCFVLSLLQCVLFIVAFGWLIPCKIPRHTDGHHYIQNWELNFYGEDFVTNVAVKSFEHKPVAVILGFKSLSNESLFGIRAVNAFDGSSIWEVNTIYKPEHIICSSVDINADDTPDCIVTSDAGEMFGLSAKDGRTIWNMHGDEVTLDVKLISKPVMESSCHSNNEPYIYAAVEDQLDHFHFVVVSGLSGRIEKSYELAECAAMPENMLWRTSNVEHEDIDPPRELIMTCENRVSSGIIYTADAFDLCKNDTSLTVNQIFFKLDIIDGARSPVRAKALKTSKGDNLAVLTHDGRIKVYGKEKGQEAEFRADRGVTFEDFVVGRFTNNSLVNVAILTSSSSRNSYNLLLLDNTSSHMLQSIPVGNGTASSMFTVHNAFNSFDTILLKVVTESEDDSMELNSTNPSSDLKHFEVKYLTLECFEMATFRIVTEDLISASCHDGSCKPDVFQERTATLADVDNDGTEELIYFTRKMLPSMLVQSVTLQFKRLVEPLAKSCNTCHC